MNLYTTFVIARLSIYSHKPCAFQQNEFLPLSLQLLECYTFTSTEQKTFLSTVPAVPSVLYISVTTGLSSLPDVSLTPEVRSGKKEWSY